LEHLRHVDRAKHTMVRPSAMVIVKVADRQADAEGQDNQQERRNHRQLISASVHKDNPPRPRPVQRSGAIHHFQLLLTIIVFELMNDVKHKFLTAASATHHHLHEDSKRSSRWRQVMGRLRCR
jgi:hypothetical protein